jgi:hypothetical protein
MSLSCFTDEGLFSKKQFMFNDDKIAKCMPLLHALNLFSLCDMHRRATRLTPFKICKGIVSAFFIADINSALYHAYLIDRDVLGLYKKYIDHDSKRIMIEANVGYGSCHHIFPSNWLDVDDNIMIRDQFGIFSPFFMFTLLCKNDEFAFMNYATLYYQGLSYVSHKYAHERNHGRFVPAPIKFLQDCGILLVGEHHRLHHKHINLNFATLSGLTDKFTDSCMNKVDEIFNLEPHEEIIDLCKKYEKLYGKNITIQFFGDIEGEIKVTRDGNILTRAETREEEGGRRTKSNKHNRRH